jgi:uncharacterized protein (TIGR04222 family)
MNPLNWTAGPFLELYCSLAAATLFLIWWWKDKLGQGSQIPRIEGLTTLHLAYLAGGAARATNTILVALFEAQAIRFRGARTLVVDHDAHPPPEWRPYLSLLPRDAGRGEVRGALSACCGRVRDDLAGRGLVASRAETASFVGQSALVLAGLVTFGVTKMLVGASRGKPVGFLFMLVSATALVGAAIAFRGPYRTRAGADALARARAEKARAARAPLNPEIPLAFALSGVAVLTGRHYQPWFAGSANGSGGSGCGSTGCGGSGCGGGGGGCGGCSG